MKHIILLQERRINIWIKHCLICNNSHKVTLGKTSKICLDCLKQKPFAERYVPAYIWNYTSEEIIINIKGGTIQEYTIIPKHYKSTWEHIKPKNLEDEEEYYYENE